MSWTSFVVRVVLLVVSVCSLLYLAEEAVPFASVLVFMMVLCIGLTWVIINLIHDDDALADFFD